MHVEMLQIVLCSFIIDRNDNKKRVFYFCFCANIYNKCKEQDKSVKRQPIDVFVNILIYIIYINMYVNYTQLYIYIHTDSISRKGTTKMRPIQIRYVI